MPYITKVKRHGIALSVSSGTLDYRDKEDTAGLVVSAEKIETPGDLNYAITELVRYYLEQKGHRYTTYNEVVGVLECAKLELYRRLVAPYEDEKIQENGDVY